MQYGMMFTQKLYTRFLNLNIIIICIVTLISFNGSLIMIKNLYSNKHENMILKGF